MPADRLAIDPAYFAGMVQVHTINHADRLGGDEVATHHAQPAALAGQGAQARLDGDAQTADGIHHAAQGVAVGDPQIPVIA